MRVRHRDSLNNSPLGHQTPSTLQVARLGWQHNQFCPPTMSENTTKSGYPCTFCRNSLNKIPFEPSDIPWLLLALRPYRCPHCFVVYRRPFAMMSVIPGVKWLASKFSGQRKNNSKPLHGSDVAGPIARFASVFGQKVQDAEAIIGNFVGVVFSVIWSVATFLPNRLLGKKKRRRRRRSRGKFLKRK